jgi:hypothetical protein
LRNFTITIVAPITAMSTNPTVTSIAASRRSPSQNAMMMVMPMKKRPSTAPRSAITDQSNRLIAR